MWSNCCYQIVVLTKYKIAIDLATLVFKTYCSQHVLAISIGDLWSSNETQTISHAHWRSGPKDCTSGDIKEGFCMCRGSIFLVSPSNPPSVINSWWWITNPANPTDEIENPSLMGYIYKCHPPFTNAQPHALLSFWTRCVQCCAKHSWWTAVAPMKCHLHIWCWWFELKWKKHCSFRNQLHP